MIFVKLLIIPLIVLGTLNHKVHSVTNEEQDNYPENERAQENPANGTENGTEPDQDNPQINIEEDEEPEIPQGFFCNTGLKDVPSLFVGGYKFWHNKDKEKDGVVRGFFYCSCKTPPPNGVSCKASASALKIGDGDWDLVRLNDNHPGNVL